MKTSYEIRDASGRLVAYHVRRDTADGKKVWWEQPDGSTGLNGTRLEELPLYGADLVSDAGADELIVVCEGEKARDALEQVKIPAVGTVTGAAGTPGPEALEVLRNRRVCLWPDNDDPGRAHMERIGHLLQGVAAEVRIFTGHDAEEEGTDAADHHAVKSGHPKAIDCLWTDLEDSPLFEPKPKAESAPVGLLLSEVKAEPVEWFWRGRIPKGKLTLFDGNPGEGKSAVCTDLAARKSVGRQWPDGAPCEAGGVVICSAEDGLSDTIRPRVDAAGGDPDRVLSLVTVPDGDGERLLSIPQDLDVIRRGIERVGAELVIVDPLMAFLSGDVNSHRDQDVRRALAPLAKLAEETGAAVLVIRHLNKTSGGNPLYRGGGSIGIIGAARSALLVARHPDDERRRVLAPLKSNLAEPAPSLAFILTEAANGAVRVEWKGETALSAAALLADPVDDEERDALTEAQAFLGEVLAGGPVPAKEVQEEAQAAGIAKRTLDRARKALGVESIRKGEVGKRGGGTWLWSLPGIKVANPETWQSKSDNRHDDPEDSAYLSEERDIGLRLPNSEDIKGTTDVGNLNRPLSADLKPGESATLEELRARRNAGEVGGG